MTAGSMRERITIESLSRVATSTGGQTEAWTVKSTVWASVKPVAGREVDEHGRLNTRKTFIIEVHFMVPVDEKDRILWRGSVLNIRGVDDRKGSRAMKTIEAELL